MKISTRTNACGLITKVFLILVAAFLFAQQGVAADVPALPRLLDVGAKTCIPCKQMAPILDELKKEYAGKFGVEFVDISEKENVPRAQALGVKLIPTQIFYDADGKELFRHEGFYGREEILGKWKELKYDFALTNPQSVIELLEPVKTDTRPKEQICYICDRDNDFKTLVVLKTARGDVRLCSPHCYFILLSCMTQEKTDIDARVQVTDWVSGKPLSATSAVFLYGADDATGRPTTKAFADKEGALKERQAAGGNLLTWASLQSKEMAARCGFCDRACYPEDAAVVKVDGLYSWGCCSHCAMGVAARTGKDIEVQQRDAHTGEMIVIKTTSGTVSSLHPPTAVAWFGQKKNADGKWMSSGCFHQGFFTTQESLRKWLAAHPNETGQQISIQQALSDKMKLTPQQIQKACKIGECAPR